MKKESRIAVFDRLTRADRAVQELARAGFAKDDIAVICPECSQEEIPARAHEEEPAGSDAPEAVAAGGAIGAILGGLTAAVGLAATGGAPLLVAGAALGAAGAGAVGGGFLGAMSSRGIEPDLADYYDRALRDGKILVGVESDDPQRLAAAERAFARAGAEPIELTSGGSA